MIKKMTGERVERTLQSIINRYHEAISRGDSESIGHTMDICDLWDLWDALLCVRQCRGIHDFKFRDTGVMDRLKAIAARETLTSSQDLICALYEAYLLGANDYSKQLAIAMDEAVNKEKHTTCDSYDDDSLCSVSPIESEV